MSTPYKVTIVNDSDEEHNFCIYQKNPAMDSYETLAWITEKISANASAEISWTDNLCFVWMEGEDTQIKSSQEVSANPTDQNTITFSKQDGAFKFSEPIANSNSNGTLTIICDDTIPSDQASVGIGTEVLKEEYTLQQGTFSTPAEMSETFHFTGFDETTFFITFGNYVQGTPMKPDQNESKGEQITFDDTQTATVTLDENNNWST